MSTGRLGAGDTAIQPTIFDAKGDLLTATAGDTPARLAAGNSGETLVADSSASTGLRWQGNYAAGKNKIINGAFDIWQRGTSITFADNAYTADRFIVQINSGSAGTGTVTQQTFTPGTAPVAGYEAQFFWRYNLTATGTSVAHYVGQKIEDVRTFAGQTITFSFYGKADSTRTITSEVLQVFGSGGSSVVVTAGTTHSFTTAWQRFSVTISVPSISGKTIGTGSFLYPRFYWTAASGATIDTWGWQVEAGSTATAFQTATGTLAGELAACQRYYWQIGTTSSGAYESAGLIGLSPDASSFLGPVQYPVAMRSIPTVTTSGTWEIKNHGITINTATISGNTNLTHSLLSWNGSGFTAWRPDNIRNQNSAGATIKFSSEL